MESTSRETLQPQGAMTNSSPFERALVIANPWAGRGKGHSAAIELSAGLRAAGIAVDVHLTTERRCGWRRVRSMEAGTDLVISIGGDGTLSEVLDGLVDRSVPVAQLPLGTANVLATELGLPRDVDRCIEMILRGKRTALDAAHVEGRLSFLCTGVGIDALAVQEVERRRRGPIRKSNYVTAVLRLMWRYRQPRLTLELDGERIDGEYGLILVSNVREYAGSFHLSSHSRRDDGQLEVYALRNASRLQLARFALTATLRELPGRVAEFLQGQRIVVRSEAPFPYQVDGDLGGTAAELHIEMRGAQFQILVP